MRSIIFLDEADSKLIVHANTVLSGSIAFECLEAITGWLLQSFNVLAYLKMVEFAQRHDGDIRKVAVLPADK
jgi:hypothetical protein